MSVDWYQVRDDVSKLLAEGKPYEAARYLISGGATLLETKDVAGFDDLMKAAVEEVWDPALCIGLLMVSRVLRDSFTSRDALYTYVEGWLRDLGEDPERELRGLK